MKTADSIDWLPCAVACSLRDSTRASTAKLAEPRGASFLLSGRPRIAFLAHGAGPRPHCCRVRSWLELPGLKRHVTDFGVR